VAGRDARGGRQAGDARVSTPVHVAAFELSAVVARALQAILPKGFRGVLTIAVDNGVVLPHDVSVQFRPPQPKAGMTRNT